MSEIRGIAVMALVLITLCLQQCEQPAIEEVQPELSEEGFIDLANNILVEKISLDMINISKSGSYTCTRNTYDSDGREIHLSVHKYVTEIYMSFIPGHFTGIPQLPAEGSAFPTIESHTPRMVDARGLFTPQIENQVDLTPPSDFGECQKYNIVIMTYKGSFDVCRGGVTVYFRNIGALSPTPTHPDPTGTAVYYLYGGFLAIIFGIVILVLFVWRRRRKS
jgi:hypothetical protein